MSHWKVLKSQALFQTGVFRLRSDECELPDGRVMPRYYVFEFPDWVNVLPVTETGELVLVSQYRHAAQGKFLEIPGGSTHPGTIAEDPRTAAERELLEETGYAATEWIYCGHAYPNPALQDNRLHTYLALGCKKVAELQLDPYEDLEVVTMDLQKAIAAWRDGEFSHALIANSIGLALKHLIARGLITG